MGKNKSERALREEARKARDKADPGWEFDYIDFDGDDEDYYDYYVIDEDVRRLKSLSDRKSKSKYNLDSDSGYDSDYNFDSESDDDYYSGFHSSYRTNKTNSRWDYSVKKGIDNDAELDSCLGGCLKLIFWFFIIGVIFVGFSFIILIFTGS